jgi:hypothetical protein|tara:strand:- start:41 stop:571 length:531 start_codon:yes stop_codon:yes gene_type:complete
MHDILDILKNIKKVYTQDMTVRLLTDFERVLDDLDLYVYANWENGELVEGPIEDRHTVSAKFMWPKDEMPDPDGGKRLLDYDIRVTYQEDILLKPREIKDVSDFRPGTRKAKMDQYPIWIVGITIPKKLISDFALKGDKDAEAEKNAIVQPDAEEKAPAQTPAPAPAEEEDLGIEI